MTTTLAAVSAIPAAEGPLVAMPGQVQGRLDGDPRGQQPEAHRDRPACPALGGLGHHPGAGEPPDDDHAGQALDDAAQRPPGQRHGTGRQPGRQADAALGRNPAQRSPGQPARPLHVQLPLSRRGRLVRTHLPRTTCSPVYWFLMQIGMIAGFFTAWPASPAQPITRTARDLPGRGRLGVGHSLAEELSSWN
jgi:hypothetical protein